MKKLKWLLLSFVFVLALGAIGYGVILFGGALIVDEEGLTLDVTTTIETSDGTVIGKLYEENRIPIALEAIPEHVQEAFIAVEDRRFYDHSGVDFISVVRAVYRDIIAMAKVEGASTITQQLAKNLFLTNDKTWLRKTKEVMAAIHLERNLSKNEILELYLNEIYFGQGVYGLEAASQKFFNKSAEDLTLSEGTLLAGMAKAPNGYSPIDHPEKAENRRNVVLQVMEDTGNISAEERLEAQGKTLGLDVQEYEPKPWAASYIDLVLKEAEDKYHISVDELQRGGYRLEVNINPRIQQIAYDKFQNEDYFPGNTEGAEGAFVMLEQNSGKVAAALGGRDYKIGDLNRVMVKRQPGSTIKPVAVYGPAMMQEAYQPYTLIPDQEMEIDGYTTTNYDDQYNGAVTIYDALVESKNAPTVWLLNDIGIPYAKDYLNKLNLPVEDEGLAIGLGGLSEGLTPLQMAESYRPFANGGKTIEALTIDQIYNREDEVIHEGETNTADVFSPQVAWNMTTILSDAVTEGTGGAGDYTKALAGKTGTTQHPHVDGVAKDAWFIGFTPEYVSAAWIGYDTSDENHYLTAGSEMPTRLTKNILSEIDKQKSLASSFDKPKNVTALPEPIDLPENITLHGSYSFAGFSLFNGKLEWTEAEDDRIVYRIYREEEGIDERIGEVEGENEFTIDRLQIFGSSSYYVVPYDPLTKLEGQRSNTVELPT
ncbi:transglycosylase domain-containing protein [Lentibacillus sp. CBA3610]|uniref:transglycosylase domain-containing protein n=1 Tax=Lentibacillus sp. CBA3610 TaxID=2518176 RepID=UPI0015958ED9|nr:PBP1A family penicillin-binding protein [Lentibacillus sp. CBA3610]QKY68518.1 PBP1A family penicillin-binding protein [Lentibacillus sp. CBA3610]